MRNDSSSHDMHASLCSISYKMHDAGGVFSSSSLCFLRLGLGCVWRHSRNRNRRSICRGQTSRRGWSRLPCVRWLRIQETLSTSTAARWRTSLVKALHDPSPMGGNRRSKTDECAVQPVCCQAVSNKRGVRGPKANELVSEMHEHVTIGAMAREQGK